MNAEDRETLREKKREYARKWRKDQKTSKKDDQKRIAELEEENKKLKFQNSSLNMLASIAEEYYWSWEYHGLSVIAAGNMAKYMKKKKAAATSSSQATTTSVSATEPS